MRKSQLHLRRIADKKTACTFNLNIFFWTEKPACQMLVKLVKLATNYRPCCIRKMGTLRLGSHII